MLNVLHPPHFPNDPNKSRIARYVHVIVRITFMALTALILGSHFQNTHGNLSVILILTATGTFSAVQLAASVMLASCRCVTTLFLFSDLRAPLRAIDGYSQALLEDYAGPLDSTGKNFLQRARQTTQRMGSRIDDMLKLSRVTRSSLKKDIVDLSSMVQAIVAELQEQQPERKPHWKIEPRLTAQADPGLLKMALDNLFGNTWKFTHKIEESRIEFGQTQMHGDKTYYVRDNCAGFDMTYANQLFQPFHRLHGQTEFEGGGIGLATLQRS